MADIAQLKQWCDDARKILSLTGKESRGKMKDRNAGVAKLLEKMKGIPALATDYAMLLKDCFSALCTVGFDPYHGFFHAGRHGKPSLALDLMEEFRPVIADSVVLTLINNESLTKADFITWQGACNLTEAGRRAFFAAYEQRKATVVQHPVYGYRMSYSRMLEVQARMLAAYVRGTVPAYPGFTVR